MSMNFGPMEILVILVVALVLFGPSKLPELGKSLGKGIREFKRGTQGLKDELEISLKDERPAAAPAPQVVQPQTAQQVVYTAAPQVVADEAAVAQAATTPPVTPAPAEAPLRAADLAVNPVVSPAEIVVVGAPNPSEGQHRA